MRRIITSAAVFLLVAASAAQAATPEDAIKYRKAVMSAMAGHIAAISMIFTGRVDGQDQLPGHAEALATTAAGTATLFPVGSGVGKTDALPLIWQENAQFQKAAEADKTATAQLRDAIQGGDKAAIGKALKSVSDSCKGCHDRYRKES